MNNKTSARTAQSPYELERMRALYMHAHVIDMFQKQALGKRKRGCDGSRGRWGKEVARAHVPTRTHRALCKALNPDTCSPSIPTSAPGSAGSGAFLRAEVRGGCTHIGDSIHIQRNTTAVSWACSHERARARHRHCMLSAAPQP
eukprot:6214118-Pleurochrysis_carterae.AAC.2